MSSPSSSPTSYLQPVRADGRRRVEGILTAALSLFSEQGVRAVTMTDIAVAADTKVGSLYRFFKTKDSIVEILFERVSSNIEEQMDALRRRAAELPPEKLADALVDLMLVLQTDREAALMLIEASPDSDRRRDAMRKRMQRAASAVITAVVPSIPQPRSELVARTMLYLSRMVAAASDDEARGVSGVLEEVRELAKSIIIKQLYGDSTRAM